MVSTDRGAEPAGLSPEMQLLLATAGGPALDEPIAALARSALDWTWFHQLVLRERAEAIVAPRLSRLAPDLPDHIRHELQSGATRSNLRMVMLDRRLDETIRAFDASGVPVLLLKGAALGRTVYGSLPRRPMIDLDLLVPVDRLTRAREAALQAGWVPGVLEDQAAFYAGHNHLAPLQDGRVPGLTLEIHSALFSPGHPFAWDVRRLWDRSVALEGSPARVPHPEDLVLHLALHFSWSHVLRFGPWRTFRDIRVLAEQQGTDWDRLVALARDTKGASAAFWTLYLARRFAAAPVPAEVERAMRPRLPATMLPMLERHFAGQWCSEELSCPSQRLERALWRLAVQPRRSGHGDARPWARDAVYQGPGVPATTESTGRKLLRHLGSPGRYLRYLQRIAVGSGA